MKNKRTLPYLLKQGVIFLTLLALASACVEDHGNGYRGNDYAASEDFSYTFNVADDGDFLVNGINGTIEVVGIAASNQIEIWGEKRVESGSSSDAEWFLDQVEARVILNGATIEVRTEQPQDLDGRNVIVHYHARIPAQWFLTAENINGNVAIAQMARPVEATLTNGELTLTSIRSAVVSHLSNGNVYLSGVEGNVSAAVTNGNIFADVDLPAGGECLLSVTNGVIDLTVPVSTSAMLDADLVNGVISTNNLTLTDIQTTPRSLHGRLGSGNGQIVLDTVNGNISIRGR